jgi:hypothetical protein
VVPVEAFVVFAGGGVVGVGVVVVRVVCVLTPVLAGVVLEDLLSSFEWVVGFVDVSLVFASEPLVVGGEAQCMRLIAESAPPTSQPTMRIRIMVVALRTPHAAHFGALTFQ